MQEVRLSSLLILFFFQTAFSPFLRSIQAEERSSPHPCARILEHVASYGKDVLQTRGARLFIKPQSHPRRAFGFLKSGTPHFIPPPQGKWRQYFRSVVEFIPLRIGSWLAREPGFKFAPLSGLYGFFIDAPIGWASQKWASQRKESAFFLKIPISLSLIIGAFDAYDEQYQRALQDHIADQISANAEAFDAQIEADFRYHTVREALRQGRLTQAEARQAAYQVSLAYSQYYTYRDANTKPLELETELAFLDHYLFVHLKNVIDDGVAPMEGFIVPKQSEGSLTAAQKLALFDVTHDLYLDYQIAVELAHDSPLAGDMRASDLLAAQVHRIEQDPFFQAMKMSYIKGEITFAQFLYTIQEDLYWQSKFKYWEIVGIIRLKHDGQSFTHEPLTLLDIRKELVMKLH